MKKTTTTPAKKSNAIEEAFTDEKELAGTVSLQEMNKLSEKICALRGRKDELNASLKDVNKELEQLENQVLHHLNTAELKTFRHPLVTLSITDYFSVKVPKTLEEKKAFFKFLEERDLFDSFVSVNSQTLNGFYKEEREAAVERGDVDFKIPGIGEPTHQQKLSVRRK